tara:strand:+ start:16 stop:324 length:309 start_codon:yes stop_codon:yes gene_type:complete
MPNRPIANNTKLIKIIFLPIFSVIKAKKDGNGSRDSKDKFGSSLLKLINIIGNSKNDIIREIIIPTLIIQPKVITGNKPEKTREENPAIVVSAVKRQGFIII